MESLREYRRKRNFQHTPEPAGPERESPVASHKTHEGGQFVIHKHAARQLHYDLRIERDGVFKSWAVPKGPSLKPGEKRLAVQVEDHPLEYGDFEGIIPEGEYGGGTVMLWDRGRWAAVAPRSRRQQEDENRFDFVLVGEKLRGAWTLVRTSNQSGKQRNNWLLIKRSDNIAHESKVTDVSVATGRSMDEIAADHDRTWTGTGEVDTVPPAPDPAELPQALKKALPKAPTPQLATLVREAPAGDAWVHEIKFDGYRILARCTSRSVRLLTRNGKDWTRRFPEIAASLKNLSAKDAIIDGEIVALSADGTTSFGALQEALSTGKTGQLVYQVFDLLHLDGHDLRGVPLTERKTALAELMVSSGFAGKSDLRFTEHVTGKGPDFAEHACKLGLEGIICKRADAPYRSGRQRDWLKVKCTGREELLICGYTDPGGARKGFGALLLGAWHKGKLIYAGRVGTGFNERMLKELHAKLHKLETKTSPFAESPAEKNVHWVRPQLIAEIEFSEWTRDGAMRHPVFRGLREDKEPEEITLPEAARANAQVDPAPPSGNNGRSRRRSNPGSVEVAGINLSNADRILYPDQGITKLALAQYYESMAPWILPHLALRPLSLVRCPKGSADECFFQKHPLKTLAKNIPRLEIEEKKGVSTYLYVHTLQDVIALVQIGALELHVWGSRVDAVEQPDILVFDLDPGPDVPHAELLRITRELGERLNGLGLESFPRTTGGKGLHLVVPIKPEREWDEVKAFCQAIAQRHAEDDPSRVTANMAKSKRQGRIFLDYLRNGRGATAIASYSTRARPGAPVAVPVTWDELTPALQPDRYNVENLRRRMSALRADPWEKFDACRRRLTAKMMKSLGLQ